MFSSWKSQGKQPQKAEQITYSVLYRTYIRLHKTGNLLWTSEFLGQITGMRPKKVFDFSGETSWWETYLMFTFVTWKARFSSKVGSSFNKGNFKSWLTFQVPRMDWLQVCLRIKGGSVLICAMLIISWGCFPWIHSFHYTRGKQWINFRSIIPWKTCLWKKVNRFNSKPLEVCLFWWEKQNGMTPTSTCTKPINKEEKCGTKRIKGSHMPFHSRSQEVVNPGPEALGCVRPTGSWASLAPGG